MSSTEDFFGWCHQFIKDCEESPLREDSKTNFNAHMKNGAVDCGKEWEKQVDMFLEKAKDDNGLTPFKYFRAVFKMMDHCETEPQLIQYVLVQFFRLFQCNNFYSPILMALERLFKARVEKLPVACVATAYKDAMQAYRVGSISSEFGIRIIIWLGHEVKLDHDIILKALLNDSNAQTAKHVTCIIRESEKPEILWLFAAEFLETGMQGATLQCQKKSLIRVAFSLNTFSKEQIFQVMLKLCSVWSSSDSTLFHFMEHGIVELCQQISESSSLQMILMQFFGENAKIRRTSAFAILCQIALVSFSPTCKNEMTRMMILDVFERLHFVSVIKLDGLCLRELAEAKLKDVEQMLDNIVNVFNASAVIAENLAVAVAMFSIALIDSAAMDVEMQLNEKMENIVDELGSNLFVNVVRSCEKTAQKCVEHLVNSMLFNCGNQIIISRLVNVMSLLIEKCRGRLFHVWRGSAAIPLNISQFSGEVSSRLFELLLRKMFNGKASVRRDMFNALQPKMTFNVQMETKILPIVFQMLRLLVDTYDIGIIYEQASSPTKSNRQISDDEVFQTDNIYAMEIFKYIKGCLAADAATKCLVYKEIIWLCHQCPKFWAKGSEMLTRELNNLPAFIFEDYVNKNDGSSKAMQSLPNLLKAASTIFSFKCRSPYTHQSWGTLAQIELDLAIEKHVEAICKIDLKDLKLDVGNDEFIPTKSTAVECATFKNFAGMLIQLFGVAIQHLWTGHDAQKEEVRIQIENLLRGGKHLMELLPKEMLFNTLNVESHLKDFSHNFEVSRIVECFEVFDGLILKENPSEDEKKLNSDIYSWLVGCAHDYVQVLTLSTFDVSTLDALSTLAGILFRFYVKGEASVSVGSKTERRVKALAMEAYVKILTLLKSALPDQFIKLLGTNYVCVSEEDSDSVLLSSPSKIKIESNFGYTKLAHEYIMFVCNRMLPDITAMRNTFKEKGQLSQFIRQVKCHFGIIRRYASLGDHDSRNFYYQIFDSLVSSVKQFAFDVDDELEVDFWRTCLSLLVILRCSKRWGKRIRVVFEALFDFDTLWTKCPTEFKRTSKFYWHALNALETPLGKLHSVLSNINEKRWQIIPDDDFSEICIMLQKIASLMAELLGMVSDSAFYLHRTKTKTFSLLVLYYTTISCLIHLANGIINSHQRTASPWQCLSVYENLIGDASTKVLAEHKTLISVYKKIATGSCGGKPIILTEYEKREDVELFSSLDATMEVFSLALQSTKKRFSAAGNIRGMLKTIKEMLPANQEPIVLSSSSSSSAPECPAPARKDRKRKYCNVVQPRGTSSKKKKSIAKPAEISTFQDSVPIVTTVDEGDDEVFLEDEVNQDREELQDADSIGDEEYSGEEEDDAEMADFIVSDSEPVEDGTAEASGSDDSEEVEEDDVGSFAEE